MRRFIFATMVLSTTFLGALGMTEDPLEQISRSWTLTEVRSLEIRGEVQFEIAAGLEPKVTVEASRALMDQLSVSNWWGAATVAIESGLRGPRERGVVKVTIELPSLRELTVLDKSSGRVTWPDQGNARLRVGENSNVNLVFDGPKLEIEASWLSSLQIKGTTAALSVVLRHQSRVNAKDLKAPLVEVALDEVSTFEAGADSVGSGVARHGSRVTLPQEGGWDALRLKEESRLQVR